MLRQAANASRAPEDQGKQQLQQQQQWLQQQQLAACLLAACFDYRHQSAQNLPFQNLIAESQNRPVKGSPAPRLGVDACGGALCKHGQPPGYFIPMQLINGLGCRDGRCGARLAGLAAAACRHQCQRCGCCSRSHGCRIRLWRRRPCLSSISTISSTTCIHSGGAGACSSAQTGCSCLLQCCFALPATETAAGSQQQSSGARKQGASQCPAVHITQSDHKYIGNPSTCQARQVQLRSDLVLIQHWAACADAAQISRPVRRMFVYKQCAPHTQRYGARFSQTAFASSLQHRPKKYLMNYLRLANPNIIMA